MMDQSPDQPPDLPPPAFPPRPPDGHKGTFGTVCVLGGQCADDRVMIGGPALAAIAALRSGCGLAVLAMPEPILPHGLTIAPSATGLALPVDSHNRLRPSEVARVLDSHAREFDCIAVGPGLGDDLAQQQIMIRLISQEEIPLVIDADGLNALAATHDFRGDFRAKAILTPHPGEFRRLAEPLGIAHDPIDPAAPVDPGARPAAAAELAQRLGCVVVLKGHRTVVSDGIESWINQTGNVALATAGTGDVLTGVIASFVAQFFAEHLGTGSNQITPEQRGRLSLFECARLGVLTHGLAADLWAAEHGGAGGAGLLASDLGNYLPLARAKIEATTLAGT